MDNVKFLEELDRKTVSKRCSDLIEGFFIKNDLSKTWKRDYVVSKDGYEVVRFFKKSFDIDDLEISEVEVEVDKIGD